MRRIYLCVLIAAVLLTTAFYSSFRVERFAREISAEVATAMDAIQRDDLPTARQALARGAGQCAAMREGMNHLLRTQDFTELEAALRSADAFLEWDSPEEACAELRRAQVQAETMEWLAGRIL